MTRHQKSLEEQLAEARAKKLKAAARLDALEQRRKARDARMRAWGEKVLVRIVLNAAAAQSEFKATLDGLVAMAELKPDERDAARWLLAGMEPESAPPANGVPALPAANHPRDGSGGLTGQGAP
jgi:hypothetical protein